jgi:hypothetical protein
MKSDFKRDKQLLSSLSKQDGDETKKKNSDSKLLEKLLAMQEEHRQMIEIVRGNMLKKGTDEDW